MLYLLDPESMVAINNDDGHVVYNLDKERLRKLVIDNRVVSCERKSFPFIPSLIDIVEMHFDKPYARFIDIARLALGSDTIYLRMWETEREGLREKDIDRHQQLGLKRVEVMQVVWNKLRDTFIKDQAIIEYNWMKATLDALFKDPIGSTPDALIDLLDAKKDIFALYQKMMGCSDFNAMNEIVTKTLNQRGYITNLFGRRLYNRNNPLERISVYTSGATNCFLGWLIYSSLYDYCTYAGGETAALLENYNGNVKVRGTKIGISLGNAHQDRLASIIDSIKNPTIIKTTMEVKVL